MRVKRKWGFWGNARHLVEMHVFGTPNTVNCMGVFNPRNTRLLEMLEIEQFRAVVFRLSGLLELKIISDCSNCCAHAPTLGIGRKCVFVHAKTWVCAKTHQNGRFMTFFCLGPSLSNRARRCQNLGWL